MLIQPIKLIGHHEVTRGMDEHQGCVIVETSISEDGRIFRCGNGPSIAVSDGGDELNPVCNASYHSVRSHLLCRLRVVLPVVAISSSFGEDQKIRRRGKSYDWIRKQRERLRRAMGARNIRAQAAREAAAIIAPEVNTDFIIMN